MDEDSNKAVTAILADPQYKAGRSLVNADRFEEAVEFFSGLLEVRVAAVEDEMSPALAPLYYEYGNALLYYAEESGAVFGDAITDAEKKRAWAAVEAAQKGSGAETQGGDTPEAAPTTQGAQETAGGGENNDARSTEAPNADQEAEQDLVLAWENLEIARQLFSKLSLTEEMRTFVAKVHLRLGDLQMINGMYNEAAEEFTACLQHRLALPPKYSRGVADAHVRSAQALFYASTLKDADKDSLVARSLEQYRLAAQKLEKMLAVIKSSPPLEAEGSNEQESSPAVASAPGKGEDKVEEQTSASVPLPAGGEQQPAEAAGKATAKAVTGSADEIQDVLDAIRETIETMSSGKDMEALTEYRNGAEATTVGFGNDSGGASSTSGSANIGETKTVGFGTGAATGAGEASHESKGSAPNGGQHGSDANTVTSMSSPAAKTSGGSVMLVKRKGRPSPKATGQGTEASEKLEAEGGRNGVKRPKIE